MTAIWVQMTKHVHLLTSLFTFFHCSCTLSPQFVDAQCFFATVATFPHIINFSEQRGKSQILCFRLFSSILSASHSRSLAGASLESRPKVWENRSWRNSFHAMWIERFGPDDSLCQPWNVKYAVTLSYGLLFAVSFILPQAPHHFFLIPSLFFPILTHFSGPLIIYNYNVLVFIFVSQSLSPMTLKSAFMSQKRGRSDLHAICICCSNRILF